MSEEEINIAIAEACGWRLFSQFKNLWTPPRSVVEYDCDAYPLPNYLNDLNAMREAEELLDDDQWLDYMLNLQDVLQRHPDRGKWVVCQENMHSTAAQRAKAFVKTIGKWKE